MHPPGGGFAGKSIRTVEGHARDGQLSVLQRAFVDHFSFQCGYCTPGFLNEGQVLLERLAKSRVPRADLDRTIRDALDGHLCRCTGYIKYHEAVRDVDAPIRRVPGLGSHQLERSHAPIMGVTSSGCGDERTSSRPRDGSARLVTILPKPCFNEIKRSRS